MIVRDGEAYLRSSLPALTSVADELVVVDTGSRDGSAALAEAHGARVLFFEWCDDFSRAKNFGVEAARYSWILNVDADEVLRAGDHLTVRAAMRADQQAAYIIYQDNVLRSGRVEPIEVLRLFRNDPRLRFRNPVHESIGESLYAGFPGYRPPAIDVHLEHVGHHPAHSGGKIDRNLRILEKWVRNEPANIFAHYKLAQTLLDSSRVGEALGYLDRTFELFAETPDRRSYPFIQSFVPTYLRVLTGLGHHLVAQRVRQTVMSW